MTTGRPLPFERRPRRPSDFTLPPQANLSVWLDGRDIDGQRNGTLSDGGSITTWTNKGSIADNPTQATPVNKPTFIASGLNGKAIARFDGGDRVVFSTASDFTFMHDGTGSTVYSVVKTSTSAVHTICATSQGGAASVGCGHRYNSTFRTNFFVNDGVLTQINANSGNNAVLNGSFDVYTSVLFDSSPDLTMYVQNVSVGTGNAVTTLPTGAPAAALHIGTAVTGISGLVGDLAQLLVYRATHDATQRAAVLAWLTGVYGPFPQS